MGGDYRKDGIAPEVGNVRDSLWWICGYCNELISEIKDNEAADVRNNPDYCPHCHVKIAKGRERGGRQG